MIEFLKKKFNIKPDGVRRVGRPKLRWEDGVDQDMRILEVKNWKVAPNRDEWAKLLKNARAHQGLSRQLWWWWWWWWSLLRPSLFRSVKQCGWVVYRCFMTVCWCCMQVSSSRGLKGKGPICIRQGTMLSDSAPTHHTTHYPRKDNMANIHIFSCCSKQPHMQ